MKKLLIILLSALSLTAFAQQKKVAVYVIGEQSGVSKVLGDQLVAAFAKSGKYSAIERTASFLAELNKEHNYERSGAVNDNQIARLGVQFGVNYVCVADMADAFGEKYISARLIDVETAEVVNTHNVSGEMNSMNSCIRMASEIAENLTKGTFAEQAKEEQLAEQRRQDAEEAAEQTRIRSLMNKSWENLLNERITDEDHRGDDRCMLGNINETGLELFFRGNVTLHCGGYKGGDWVGDGMLIRKDRTAFVGEFKSAYRWKCGSLYDEKGKLIHYGKFSGTEPQKPSLSRDDGYDYTFGIINYENGDKYVGELRNGLRHGKGLYIYAEGDGIAWYGDWIEGIRNGEGIFFL